MNPPATQQRQINLATCGGQRAESPIHGALLYSTAIDRRAGRHRQMGQTGRQLD